MLKPFQLFLFILALLIQPYNALAKSMGQFTPYIYLTTAYSDNVTAGSDLRQVVVAGFPTALTPPSLERNDWSTLVVAGVNHKYLIGLLADSLLLWKSNATFYDKSYQDFDDFDLRTYRVTTGPVLKNIDWQLSVPLTYETQLYDGRHFTTSTAINPIFSYTKQKNITPYIGAGWKQTDYYGNLYTRRDQITVSTRAGARVQLKKGMSITPFYEYSDTDVELNTLSRESHRYGFNISMDTPDNGTVQVSWSQVAHDYEGIDPSFLEQRNQLKESTYVKYSRPMDIGPLKDLFFEGMISHDGANASIPIYEYQETVTSVTLGKTF